MANLTPSATPLFASQAIVQTGFADNHTTLGRILDGVIGTQRTSAAPLIKDRASSSYALTLCYRCGDDQ